MQVSPSATPNPAYFAYMERRPAVDGLIDKCGVVDEDDLRCRGRLSYANKLSKTPSNWTFSTPWSSSSAISRTIACSDVSPSLTSPPIGRERRARDRIASLGNQNAIVVSKHAQGDDANHPVYSTTRPLRTYRRRDRRFFGRAMSLM